MSTGTSRAGICRQERKKDPSETFKDQKKKKRLYAFDEDKSLKAKVILTSDRTAFLHKKKKKPRDSWKT
ncbi:MAG: hypothetical protein V1866_04275 [archaeon]